MKTNGRFVFSVPMSNNIHHFELFYWPEKINMAKKRKTAGFIEFCPLPSMVNLKGAGHTLNLILKI